MGCRTKLILALMLALVTIMVAGGAEEPRKVVPASDVLAKIQKGDPINYDNSIIEGNLNFGASASIINRQIHFNNTIFQDAVDASSTSFNEAVYFEHSKFNGDATFEDTKLNGYASFDGSSFNGTAYFHRAWFDKYASFRGIKFNGDASFDSSRFNGSTYFDSTNFKGYASFDSTEFNGTANFDKIIFNGTAYFHRALLERYASFDSPIFNKYAYFGSTRFNGYTYFGNTSFNSLAYFEDSRFNGTADFERARFNGDTYFDNSRFNKTTIFDDAVFQNTARFSDSKFLGNTSLNNSLFNKDALFEGANLNCTLYLTRTKYTNLYISWRNIKNLAYDDAAYLSLMENFKNLGYIEDYDNCYFEYRKEHRSQNWSGGFHGMSPIEERIRKVFDFGLEVSYGYGKRPLNPLGWSIFFIGLFAMIWMMAGLDAPLRFSFKAFLSGTRLFIDPPKIPEQTKFSKSVLEDILSVERALGALFSVLFFLAIGATMIR